MILIGIVIVSIITYIVARNLATDKYRRGNWVSAMVILAMAHYYFELGLGVTFLWGLFATIMVGILEGEDVCYKDKVAERIED